MEILENYKLQIGDDCTIWFEEEKNPYCYADCRYDGKHNGKWCFTSNTYGWKFFIDVKTGEVTNSDFTRKMKVNNDTGWMKVLP